MSAKLSQFIEYRDIEMIDLDDIYDMECQSYDFPWTRNILKDCIMNRYDSYLATHNNTIVGYIISKAAATEPPANDPSIAVASLLPSAFSLFFFKQKHTCADFFFLIFSRFSTLKKWSSFDSRFFTSDSQI